MWIKIGWKARVKLQRNSTRRLVNEADLGARTGSGCFAYGRMAQEINRVIVHSEQGSQYGSDDFKRFCAAHNLEPSMSRRGNCRDNAVAESFFSSLKTERIRKRIYKNRELARADVFDYIEIFYNRTRRHSHLGGISPEAVERAAA